MEKEKLNILDQIEREHIPTNQYFAAFLNQMIEDGFDLDPVYTVKELSEIIEVSEHNIRFFDKSNLFPFVARDEKNRRLFSKADAYFGRTIYCMRGVHFSLDEIQHYIALTLQGEPTIGERIDMFREKEVELDAQLEELQQAMRKLKIKKAFFEDIEKEIQREKEAGTYTNKNRGSLRNARIFIQKQFFDEGLIDEIEIDIKEPTTKK